MPLGKTQLKSALLVVRIVRWAMSVPPGVLHVTCMSTKYDSSTPVNGYVFKTVGDAFCATFDTATDALEEALQRLEHISIAHLVPRTHRLALA
jgi:hypothetical protein